MGDRLVAFAGGVECAPRVRRGRTCKCSGRGDFECVLLIVSLDEVERFQWTFGVTIGQERGR